MKKSELVAKLNQMYTKLEDIETDAENVSIAIGKIRREFEDLPSEVDEIDDDDPEEEKKEIIDPRD